MRVKRILSVFLAFLIGAAAGILFILPGFQKRTDVCLRDFSVSEDAITVKTSPAGSMGFIRAMETEASGGEIHCSFYCAFGGLNSGFGAKDVFEIQLDDSAETIYFDRGTSPDVLVLERDAESGAWTPVYPYLPQA